MSTEKNERDDSGGTPMEQLLREALAARARQVGPHDLRPADPPNRRPRTLRPVYAVVAPLALAAAVVGSYLGFQPGTVADHLRPAPAASLPSTPAPSPSSSGSPAPAPSPSGSAGSSPASQAPSGTASGQPSTGASASTDAPAAPVSMGAVRNYRGVKFQLPSGWSVSAGSGVDQSICLASPDAPSGGPLPCGPNGVLLTVYSTSQEVSQAIDPTFNELSIPDGWAHQPYCYDPQNPHSGNATLAGSTLGAAVSLPTGQASLSSWDLDCAGGGSFTVRRWGFAQQGVILTAQGMAAKDESGVQGILNSLDLSGHPALLNAPVSISTSGLGQVPDDNSKVPFSVTFTNTGSTPLLQVVPDVTVPGAGSGTLEEQHDDGSWAPVRLGAAGPEADIPAFPLAAGAAKTVAFRVSFAPDPNFAQAHRVLSETAWLKFVPEGSFSAVGTATVPLPTAAN